MNKVVTIIFSIFFSLSTYAQEYKSYKDPLKLADKAFENNDFSKATSYYKKAIEMKKGINVKDVPMHKNYGTSLIQTGEYEQAQLVFENLLKAVSEEEKLDIEEKEELMDLRGYSERIQMNGTQLQYYASNPRDILLTNMGVGINSKYDECCLTYTPIDTLLFFSSKRKPVKGKMENGQYPDDIYYAKRATPVDPWKYPKNVGKKFNGKEQESSPFLDRNGEYIYFERYLKPKKADKKIGYGGGLDIYVAKVQGANILEAEILPIEINSKSWDAHPTITKDGNTLYFSSKRPGGQGARDLYLSTKDSEGKWTTAQNLGEIINTKFDEISPYITPDGSTLYFSSNGREGMGNYDIYKSKRIGNNQWSEPENMGAPINSEAADMFFRLYGSGEDTLHFSSNRKDGYGRLDIYASTEMLRMNPFSASYTGEGTVPEEEKIVEPVVKEMEEVVKKTTEQIQESDNTAAEEVIDTVGQTTSSIEDTAVSGMEQVIDSVQTEMVERKLIEEEIPENLPYEEVKKRLPLNIILFDFDKHQLKEEAKKNLDDLANYLNKYPQVIMAIDGHTDLEGSHAYNMDLSVDRVNEAVNYLISKGVEKSRLLGRCYGETKPTSTRVDEEGKQMNRRVEFLVMNEEKIKRYKSMSTYRDTYVDEELLDGMNINTASDNKPVTRKPKISTVGDKSMQELIFTIQIGAYYDPPETDDPIFQTLDNVIWRDLGDDITRITTGEFGTYNEAKNYLNSSRIPDDFPGAYITAYHNGKRILIHQAAGLLSE